MKRGLQRTLLRASGRRGFTMTEIMISIAISSLVIVAVMSTQYISGRGIKEMYGQTRTRSSRMRALDQIRYRLCEAKISSIVVKEPKDDGTSFHRIEFIDPNLKGPTSVYYFVTAENTLYYDDDISDEKDAWPVVEGPIDISFELQNAGAIIYLRVKSKAEMVLGDVDLQDGETAIYVRNT